MPGKTTIIFNPLAQSEKAGILWYEMYKVAARKAKIRLTRGPGHATKKARKAVARGYSLIVAAGGDGTINEVLNGIIGTDVALGIIPIGSVNVLARELKIPLSIPEAWKVIEDGVTQVVDLVRVEYHVQGEPRTRHFIQLAGVGLDAEIVRKVTWERKRRWGPFSYVLESLRSAATEMPSIQVKIDDSPAVKGAFALIGNGTFYGGPFPIFHKASMTDGLLDVCIFQSSGFLDLLYYFQAVLRGAQASIAGIAYHHAQKVEISAEAEVPLEVDGEFVGHLPARFEIIPKALKIVVPSQTLAD